MAAALRELREEIGATAPGTVPGPAVRLPDPLG